MKALVRPLRKLCLAVVPLACGLSIYHAAEGQPVQSCTALALALWNLSSGLSKSET